MSVATRQWAEPTQRIVQAIADEEGVEPGDLDPPLFDVLDGDLLNALVASNEENADHATLELAFEYLGYTVRVAAGGAVTVAE